MNENALTKVSSIDEMFCEQIGDKEMRLAKYFLKYLHKAILLMLVEDFGTGNFVVLAVSYNLRERCITEVKTFDRRNCDEVEKFVGEKLIGNFMEEVTNICDSEECRYLLEDGNIYYIGENGMIKIWVASIDSFGVDKVAEIFHKAERQGEIPCLMKIDGSDYWCVQKGVADKILGKDKDRVCSSLADAGVIYFKEGDGKNNNNRYCYRLRIMGADGKVESIYYFAVRAEFYDYSSKGGLALSA
ncbi:MAG: hypothetical protein NC452_20545 [Eubacterium sp.]|nr:hypothetical protein [Eubacterium sp.]